MGIITKGFSMGRAYLRNQASKKAFKTAKGTTKLQHPVIKSVPVSKTVKEKGAEASVKKVKSDAYVKNIDKVNKYKEHVKRGEAAKKKLEHMVGTKQAYHIGRRKSVHPRDPGKSGKQIGEN